MKRETLSFYLYITWDDKNNIKTFNAYISVLKTMLKEEGFSKDLQLFGDQAIAFSSYYNFEYIKNKLEHKRYPYLLIDTSLSFSNDTMSYHLDDMSLKKIEEFISNSRINQIKYLEMKIEDAVSIEEYETAAFYRDEVKKQKQLIYVK